MDVCSAGVAPHKANAALSQGRDETPALVVCSRLKLPGRVVHVDQRNPQRRVREETRQLLSAETINANIASIRTIF